MKPLQIGVLMVAGALGGALVMRVVQRPQPVSQARVVRPEAAPAQASAPAPAPSAAVPPATPTATTTPEPEPKPSPVAGRRKPVQPPPVRHAPPVTRPKPVIVARQEPVHSMPQAVPQVPAPSTPMPVEAAPATPPPPVRTEPENVTPPPPPPPAPRKVTLNAGTLIPVRLVDGLSSDRNAPGDPFTATLDKELVVDGLVVAERGTRVEGRVVASDRGGKVRGVSALAVELTRLHTSDGQNVAIETDSFERHAEASHNEDAAKIGGAAAVGAIIGAIAGGGKGAAIGAGVGGGAGAGDVLMTRGKATRLPSETRISFRLRTPVTLTERL